MKNNENNINTQSCIIELEHYSIFFEADYAGFLYVNADEFIIQHNDKSEIYVKKSLNKYFIDERDFIYIKNPKNLQNIKFEKFDTSKINKYKQSDIDFEKMKQKNDESLKSIFDDLQKS